MNTRAAVVLRGLLALAALLAAAGTVAAREAVSIRASEQAGYARLVFDWSEPVAFTAATRDRNLWIRFDRPLRADPDTLVRLLARYVAAARLSEDGKGLDIALTAPLRLDSFAMGKSVVFDLRPVGAAATTWRGIHVAGFTDSARSADSTIPALPVRVGDHENICAWSSIGKAGRLYRREAGRRREAALRPQCTDRCGSSYAGSCPAILPPWMRRPKAAR
jgi:hypothetical protein